MIEVQEMSDLEIDDVLERVGYGHFACSRNDRPYIVPINYAYDKFHIYIYTTDGMKSDIINANPQVCLQVEEVIDKTNWRSVVINGEAEQIIDPKEREAALTLILSTNPTLTPAISVRWMDSWVRENREVVYRIKPLTITGRSSVKLRVMAAVVPQGNKRRFQLF